MKGRKCLWLATVLTLSSLVPTPAGAALFPSDTTPDHAVPNTLDRTFIRRIAQGLRFKLAAETLALSRSPNRTVRQFVQRLIRDHSRELAQLSTLANRLGISLPDDPDDDQSEQLEQLSGLIGPTFQRAFLRAEIRDHMSDLRDFTEQSFEGRNATVRAFATNQIPEVSEHIEEATNLLNILRPRRR